MSTLKTDAITAISAGGDLSLDGLGTGGVSIASTLKMTKGGDIASASPLVIDTDGNYFDVTGTTSFSVMTVEAGNFFMLQFDGALTITHGSGIELPGAANLTTAAGDRLICYATAANTVEVMSVETEAAAGGGSDIQTFASSGTWTKPSSGSAILVFAWGAGGAGGSVAGGMGGGGGGGSYGFFELAIGDAGSTETVTIGAGGVSPSSPGVGLVGGNSTFGSLFTVYGGGGGGSGGDRPGGGGGGSIGGAGNVGTASVGGAAGIGGAPDNPTGADGTSNFGGGSGARDGSVRRTGGHGGWGGGGGGATGSNSDQGGTGGASAYGGGGGASGVYNTQSIGPGGVSTYGGNGGAGSNNSTAAVAGTIPGGAGGGGNSTELGANGANGKMIVITV